MLEGIGNTVSLDPLYRGLVLVILLGWLLSRLASNRLIVRTAKSRLGFILFSIYCLFWNLGLGFNVTSYHHKLSHYNAVIFILLYDHRT